MFTPNVVSLLLFSLLPLYTTVVAAAAPGSALALIAAQPDLKLITALIKRDPEVVKLYSSVTNATIVAAVDSSFTSTDPNNIVYSNREEVRAILQDIVISGVYPTRSITKKPIYANTKLVSPRFVDTSRGAAVAKLVEANGKKTVDVGAGFRANITQGNLRFNNGLLHKISNPLNPPVSFTETAATLNITAIDQLAGGFAAIFQLLTKGPDTTLFAISNKAFETLEATQPAAELDTFLDALAYYVVSPGVYFEGDFTGKTVKALNGAELRLEGFGKGGAKVNNARVVKSDIFATNGVLHILDRPLNPVPAPN